MKIRFDASPTMLKVMLALALTGGGFFSFQTVIYPLYEILWIPFEPYLRFPPFACRDKPMYVATYGAILAGAVWSVVLYVVLSIKIGRKRE